MGLLSMYRGGKPVKALYYCGWILRRLRPRVLLRHRLRRLLRTWEERADASELRVRVRHYCPAEPSSMQLPADAEYVRKLDSSRGKRVYYIDIERYLAYFPRHLRISFQPGDVYTNPTVPSIIKARRLDDSNGDMATVFNLNRVRHFPRPHDHIPFSRKKPVLFFRGKIGDKPGRIRFFEKWHGHPLTDLGDTSRHPVRAEWGASKIPVASHFAYKYILVLEGNDVGSSLQWVMGSDCVPVMTRPRVEYWLMHSRLEAGVHYIEIADDYSDVAEKLEWYMAHPDEAEKIARASREYYSQFLDRRRERDISLLTLARYFEATGQHIFPGNRDTHKP